MLNRLGVDH